MLSISVRLQSLRADSLPLFVWGSAAWQMWEEVFGTATIAIIRMTHITHGMCQAGESWVVWHRDLAPALVACAVGGVARLAACPACSVVGRALWWRSAADVQCLHSLAGRILGALGRRKR